MCISIPTFPNTHFPFTCIFSFTYAFLTGFPLDEWVFFKSAHLYRASLLGSGSKKGERKRRKGRSDARGFLQMSGNQKISARFHQQLHRPGIECASEKLQLIWISSPYFPHAIHEESLGNQTHWVFFLNTGAQTLSLIHYPTKKWLNSQFPLPLPPPPVFHCPTFY